MSYSFPLLLFFSAVTNVFSATPAQVKEIAENLVCLCGTCNRESLSTCLCNHGQSERDRISREIDRGKATNEIIKDFRDEFGDVVLASPPAEGINLLAWIAPITALLLGAIILRLFIKRRVETPFLSNSRETSPQKNPLDDEQHKRLQNELKQFEESE